MTVRAQTVVWAVVATLVLGVHVYLSFDHGPRPTSDELSHESSQLLPSAGREEEQPAAVSPGAVGAEPPAPAAVEPAAEAAAEGLHLDLFTRLLPDTHYLEVAARVTLTPELAEAGEAHFLLHRDLDPRSATAEVRVEEAGVTRLGGDAVLYSYRVTFPRGGDRFELRYGGEIYHPVQEYGQDYARSFGWTRGMIGDDYIYLSRGAGWYPIFGDEMLRFRLEVRLPPGWTGVSQGDWVERGEVDGQARMVWEELQPQDDIYLLAAPFRVYERPVSAIDAQVFLRDADPALAARYLEATEQYLTMYQELLGPYSYRKFALVENFWETGYGMPSFTLLGPTVIRLPFIPTSSYPHEILHNWWGNGVYVDYASGNWSEGLTAYLSDHLIQEQRGRGAAHRQSALQKYVDYVSSDQDFPLRAFRSRHGSASEAVGYTKMMMLAHMLRLARGDEVFVESLRRFYRDNRFRVANFADLEAAFAATVRRDLADYFAHWVERVGAPELVLADVRVTSQGAGYDLHLTLRQTHAGRPYPLLVPLAATLEGREETEQLSLHMRNRELEWVWSLPGRPLRIDVDPEFDLMRRLHPEEIPPALSGVFGAPAVTVVLPTGASAAARDAYQALARSWQASGNVDLEMIWDDDVPELPDDRAVWLFGWENRLLEALVPALHSYGATITGEGARLPSLELAREGNGVALGVRHPSAPQQGLGVFAADRSELIPSLGRRLPHFHKYSYLVFEGERGENTLRGRWPVVSSPLTAWLGEADREKVPMAALRERTPLVPAPPIVQQAKY